MACAVGPVLGVKERRDPDSASRGRGAAPRQPQTEDRLGGSGGARGASLIINLPGKPAAIRTCLDAVFAAVPYCIDLIGGPRLETNPRFCVAFRPKA